MSSTLDNNSNGHQVFNEVDRGYDDNSYVFEDMALSVLDYDDDDTSEDGDDVEVHELHTGVDWGKPPPPNTLLFAAGWGNFGLSPILHLQ